MLSNHLFLIGTLLLSLNFVRFLGLAISDWFYLGALVLALFETLLFDRKNIICWTRNRFYLPAGMILFGALISTFSARDFQIALIEILQQLFVVTLFISLIWVMVRRGRTNAVIQAFIISGAFTALIASIDYFAGTNFGPILSGTPDVKLWGRFAGATGHPNKLGYFLAITSLLSIAYVTRLLSSEKKFSTTLWFLMLLIQLFGLYLSGSVTAYLGFICGFVLLIASSKSIRSKLLRLSMVIILISIPIISILSLLGLEPIAVSIAAFQKGQPVLDAIDRVRSNTALSRWILYDYAVQRIVDNPFIGVGYDQLSTSGLSLDLRMLPGTVHNALLQIWYAGGFFAFIGWLSIFIYVGWIAISTIFQGKVGFTPVFWGLSSTVIAILLMDQFQDAIYQREKWLAIGLFVGEVWGVSHFSSKGDRL